MRPNKRLLLCGGAPIRVRQCVWILSAIASATAIRTAAIAQTSVEVGPLVALYAPVGTYNPNAGYSTALPSKPSDLGGVAWGALGRLWLTPKLGVQLRGAATSSRFGGGMCCPGGIVTSPTRATVVTVAAEALHRPAPAKFPLWFSAGLGIVRHGGPAYAPYGAPSPLAGVLGLGFDVHIGAHLTAALGVTELFYSLNFKGNGSTFEHGPQTDVLAHVALAWRSRWR